MLWQSIRYGIATIASRRLFMVGMIFVPILCLLFFVTLMTKGLPTEVPTAIVDLDNSAMSRAMVRNMDATQLVHVTESCESYHDAMAAVRQGRVFGFYMIPRNFQEDAIAGRKPTVSLYMNMSYFVPGTFSYKGYRTVAVQSAMSLLSSTAVDKGIPARMVASVIRPMAIDINPVHNPWTNYSLYLTPSFVAALFELMIVLLTIVALTYEIKHGYSRQWLADNGGSVVLAVTGKLLPMTVIFTLVGWCMLGIMYGFAGFPLNCSPLVMYGLIPIFVLACQAFGLFWCCVMPSPRFALSMGALFSVLAFSSTGFSFPVQNMYGFISIFQWMMPVRYYFLIHSQQALNGFDLYYSRLWFVILILYTFIPALLLWRFKRACIKQIYVQ